jgi:hypothetical protein
MDTSNIIENLLEGNISGARAETESILLKKINESIESYKDAIVDGVYGLSEKKKVLDPVGQEDDDIDNDGDEDESDEYLKNRRKVRKKEIENEEVNYDEDDLSEGGSGDSRIEFIYGMKVSRYEKLSDKQKAQVKQRWYNERAMEEKKRGQKS